MVSKKYILLAGLFTLFSAEGLLAQESNTSMYRGGGYDFSDTSLIPESRLAQQRDFMNGQYDFPAKPRNQWEIGITGGFYNVSGDVRSKSLIINSGVKPINTLGWGIHVRKAWGYVLSTRLQYIHGSASGFNHQASKGYWGHGSPWMTVGGGYATSDGKSIKNVYYNYHTTTNELSLQAIASLNNLKFHRARNKVSYYALVGLGAMTYHTTIDALDASGKVYDFSTIDDGLTGSAWETRKEKNTRLKALFDGDYETEAEKHDNRNTWNSDKTGTLRVMTTFGGGAQIRLGKKLSLQIEDKITLTNDDLIDGQRWQEMGHTSSSNQSNPSESVSSGMTSDIDNINYFSIGLNVHLGGKSVDPLWWMNPMDYGYNEMKRPKGGASKCDNDADGDGISDCFDRCPNTPGGVSVDSHGCPFDTDGDGVADYKDKQLITPTECQPVDADGVGRCPDPACCKDAPPPAGCSSISAGSIAFASGASKLSSAAMSQLNGLAGSMRSNPNCKAVIVGCGNGSKIEQQRSWDRVNSVINYMVDKQGIDRERFIFQYGTSCDANAVEYRSAGQGEEGPSNTPPPFPNLRRN